MEYSMKQDIADNFQTHKCPALWTLHIQKSHVCLHTTYNPKIKFHWVHAL